MTLLKLAIVGRPNVGKSALFNRIAKNRIAIVDEVEGVTRDRNYAEADFFGHPFLLIDTGGIDPQSTLPFQEETRRQAEIAIVEADTIVMVVDALVGPTLLDKQVADLLLRSGKRVCLAINKIDHRGLQLEVHQFYSLGITRMIGISALHGFQVAELLDMAFEQMTFPERQEVAKGLKIALIGRPNVGKSTLLNQVLKEERSIVSPIAGTTRDSIDATFTLNGQDYTFIDTAGLKNKKSEGDAIEKFAAMRTEKAIERSDICLLMLDAQTGMTAYEKKVTNKIEEAGKGCILLFNKWDLVKGFRMEHCLKALQQEASFLKHCPTLFLSAHTGRNVDQIFPAIDTVATHIKNRISTGQLNKFLEKAIHKYNPPTIQGRRLRIYYLTQVGITPPHFVLFVNHPDLMVDTYMKYLIHQFRETYLFSGCPLVFNLKGKKARENDSFEDN